MKCLETPMSLPEKQKVSVLRALRPQRDAMKSDHMRVHAFDVDKVTTDLARNVAGRVGNRLLN